MRAAKADVAQLAERVLGKDEVTSSILVIGSILRSNPVSAGRSNRAALAVERRLDWGYSGGVGAPGVMN